MPIDKDEQEFEDRFDSILPPSTDIGSKAIFKMGWMAARGYDLPEEAEPNRQMKDTQVAGQE